MSIIIGSFNLYKFKGESSNKSAKNLRRIADIIKGERFDIIALQEVFTDFFLCGSSGSLMKHLGNNYDCIWQPSEGKLNTYREGYAFIWNTTKFNRVGNDEGEIYKRHGARKKLVRPPLVARFVPVSTANNGFIELRLITTHMVFNKPPTSSDSDAEFRRKELKVLTEEVYPDIADDRFGNFRPAYTLLMGDYNLCIEKTPRLNENMDKVAGLFEVPIPGSAVSLFNRKERMIVTTQNELTSLKRPKKDPSSTEDYDVDKESDDEEEMDDSGTDYYSKDYDHVSYDTTRFEGVKVVASRVDALGKYYQNDLQKYRHEVSDHVPIKIQIDFNS